MKLTKDQVKHVAKLANLPITPEEESKYSEQLSKILDYVDKLNEVDTSNVEPTFNVTGLSNVTREDETAPSISYKKGFFEIKVVFENE